MADETPPVDEPTSGPPHENEDKNAKNKDNESQEGPKKPHSSYKVGQEKEYERQGDIEDLLGELPGMWTNIPKIEIVESEMGKAFRQIQEIFPNSILEIATERLQKQKILILHSQENWCRRDFALAISMQMKLQGRMTEHSWLVEPLRESEPLGIKKLKGKKSTIIFNNFLAKKNKDLKRFLQNIVDSPNFLNDSSLIKSWAAINCNIVLVADSESLQGLVEHLPKALLLELPRPLDEKIKLSLKTQFERLQEDKKLSTGQREFLVSQTENLIEKMAFQLTSFDQIKEVISQLRLAMIQDPDHLPELENIDQLLDLSASIFRWIDFEIRPDFEVFSYFLALVLLYNQPQNQAINIPKSIFSTLKGYLADFLKKRFKVRQSRRPDWEASFRSETIILDQCRAEVTFDKNLKTQCIAFKDPQMVEVIWRVLIKHYGQYLIEIKPLLLELATLPELRFDALRSLGKISELFTSEIKDLIHEWSASRAHLDSLNVGYIINGIVASSNPHFVSFGFEVLRNLTIQYKSNITWTAIVAYKQIGIFHPEMAIREYGKILSREMSDLYAGLRKYSKKSHWRFNQLFNGASLGDLVEGIIEDSIFQRLQKRWNQQQRIYQNIRHSIVALCFMRSPSEIISIWHRWLKHGHKYLPIALCEMLIFKKGVFHELNQTVIIEDINGQGGKRWNYFVFAVLSDPDKRDSFSEFMTDVYASFRNFPTEERLSIKKELRRFLNLWVNSSLGNQEALECIAKFLLSFAAFSEDFDKELARMKRKWKNRRKESGIAKFLGYFKDESSPTFWLLSGGKG